MRNAEEKMKPQNADTTERNTDTSVSGFHLAGGHRRLSVFDPRSSAVSFSTVIPEWVFYGS